MKNKSQFIQSFSELIDHYDVFIFDLWGVIHDGFKPYPGVVECLEHLLKMKKTIFFLSNAPRPGEILMKKLIDFGINFPEITVVSSGDLVRRQLQSIDDPVFSKLELRCYHLGATRNQDILSDIKIEVVPDLEQANFILLTVYADEGEDLTLYDSLFEKSLHYGLPVICANPDGAIMNGDKLRYCAGVFAERYEKMGGKVHYYGKPHPEVFEMIFEKLKKEKPLDRSLDRSLVTTLDRISDRTLNKNRILMIGDTLETDILGATRVGIASALICTGNIERYLRQNRNQADYRNQEDAREEILRDLFAKQGIAPNWVVPCFKCDSL